MKKQPVHKWMPIMYVTYFGILQKLAKEHGYILCVHGSVVRDFDLVAVPFDETVSPHKVLLDEIKKAIGSPEDDDESFEIVGYEPHGRICYTIQCGAGGYFDISFTPSLQQAAEYLSRKEWKSKEINQLIEATNKMPEL